MLAGEESSILNVAYPLNNRWNACNEVGTIFKNLAFANSVVGHYS